VSSLVNDIINLKITSTWRDKLRASS